MIFRFCLLDFKLKCVLLLCAFGCTYAKSSTDFMIKSKKESLAYRIPIDPQHFYWPWKLKILESDAMGNVYPYNDDNGQSGKQKWIIIWKYNDTFAIQNRQTHLCLENDLSGKVFTNACMRGGAQKAQKWEFLRGGKWDGLKHLEWYWIRNELTNQLLDHDELSVFTRGQESNDVDDSQKWHLYLCKK